MLVPQEVIIKMALMIKCFVSLIYTDNPFHLCNFDSNSLRDHVSLAVLFSDKTAPVELFAKATGMIYKTDR